jgi:hypothetical protein
MLDFRAGNMKIKIIDVDYTVNFQDPALFDFADVFGYCDKITRHIYIDNSLDTRVMRDTLLHEILHALWAEWRFPESQEEESTVTWLARALETFFHDNPQFIKRYLM